MHLLAPLPPSKGTLAASKRESQSEEATPPPKRPAKVSLACAACQKAHTSCDAARPCARCVKRGESDKCVDAPRKPPRVSQKNKDPSASVAQQPCGSCPLNRSLRPILPKPILPAPPPGCAVLAPKPQPGLAAALGSNPARMLANRSQSDPNLANLSLFQHHHHSSSCASACCSNSMSPAINSPFPGTPMLPHLQQQQPQTPFNRTASSDSLFLLPEDDISVFRSTPTQQQQQSFFMLPDDDLPTNTNNTQPLQSSQKRIPPCHIPSLVSGPGGFVYDNVDNSWLDMLLHPPPLVSQPPPGAIVNFEFGLMNWLSSVPQPGSIPVGLGGSSSGIHDNPGMMGSLGGNSTSGMMTNEELQGMMNAFSSGDNVNSAATTGTTTSQLLPLLSAVPQHQRQQQEQPLFGIPPPQVSSSSTSIPSSAPLITIKPPPKARKCPVKSKRAKPDAPAPATVAPGTNVVTVDTFLTDLEHLLAPSSSNTLNMPSSSSSSSHDATLKSFSSEDVSAWIDQWGKEIQDEKFGTSGCGVGCSDCPFHDPKLDW
ncbi:hypothetical protein HDU79_007012 [Rhizoclosmatium sp. JEL0117]|nr:hypothetical protein HDU79_007012 [Rhizoclosmatium sp. JEL0117]